ncbi:hypothetical protein BDW75DRAFT_219970 [Aspergillus navahoensis]
MSWSLARMGIRQGWPGIDFKSVWFRNGMTEICENLTMDASQAWAAPFVFFMITKPSAILVMLKLPQKSHALPSHSAALKKCLLFSVT